MEKIMEDLDNGGDGFFLAGIFRDGKFEGSGALKGNLDKIKAQEALDQFRKFFEKAGIY